MLISIILYCPTQPMVIVFHYYNVICKCNMDRLKLFEL